MGRCSWTFDNDVVEINIAVAAGNSARRDIWLVW